MTVVRWGSKIQITPNIESGPGRFNSTQRSQEPLFFNRTLKSYHNNFISYLHVKNIIPSEKDKDHRQFHLTLCGSCDFDRPPIVHKLLLSSSFCSVIPRQQNFKPKLKILEIFDFAKLNLVKVLSFGINTLPLSKEIHRESENNKYTLLSASDFLKGIVAQLGDTITKDSNSNCGFFVIYPNQLMETYSATTCSVGVQMGEGLEKISEYKVAFEFAKKHGYGSVEFVEAVNQSTSQRKWKKPRKRNMLGDNDCMYCTNHMENKDAFSIRYHSKPKTLTSNNRTKCFNRSSRAMGSGVHGHHGTYYHESFTKDRNLDVVRGLVQAIAELDVEDDAVRVKGKRRHGSGSKFYNKSEKSKLSRRVGKTADGQPCLLDPKSGSVINQSDRFIDATRIDKKQVGNNNNSEYLTSVECLNNVKNETTKGDTQMKDVAVTTNECGVKNSIEIDDNHGKRVSNMCKSTPAASPKMLRSKSNISTPEIFECHSSMSGKKHTEMVHDQIALVTYPNIHDKESTRDTADENDKNVSLSPPGFIYDQQCGEREYVEDLERTENIYRKNSTCYSVSRFRDGSKQRNIDMRCAYNSASQTNECCRHPNTLKRSKNEKRFLCHTVLARESNERMLSHKTFTDTFSGDSKLHSSGSRQCHVQKSSSLTCASAHGDTAIIPGTNNVHGTALNQSYNLQDESEWANKGKDLRNRIQAFDLGQVVAEKNNNRYTQYSPSVLEFNIDAQIDCLFDSMVAKPLCHKHASELRSQLDKGSRTVPHQNAQNDRSEIDVTEVKFDDQDVTSSPTCVRTMNSYTSDEQQCHKRSHINGISPVSDHIESRSTNQSTSHFAVADKSLTFTTKESSDVSKEGGCSGVSDLEDGEFIKGNLENSNKNNNAYGRDDEVETQTETSSQTTADEASLVLSDLKESSQDVNRVGSELENELLMLVNERGVTNIDNHTHCAFSSRDTTCDIDNDWYHYNMNSSKLLQKDGSRRVPPHVSFKEPGTSFQCTSFGGTAKNSEQVMPLCASSQESGNQDTGTYENKVGGDTENRQTNTDEPGCVPYTPINRYQTNVTYCPTTQNYWATATSTTSPLFTVSKNNSQCVGNNDQENECPTNADCAKGTAGKKESNTTIDYYRFVDSCVAASENKLSDRLNAINTYVNERLSALENLTRKTIDKTYNLIGNAEKKKRQPGSVDRVGKGNSHAIHLNTEATKLDTSGFAPEDSLIKGDTSTKIAKTAKNIRFHPFVFDEVSPNRNKCANTLTTLKNYKTRSVSSKSAQSMTKPNGRLGRKHNILKKIYVPLMGDQKARPGIHEKESRISKRRNSISKRQRKNRKQGKDTQGSKRKSLQLKRVSRQQRKGSKQSIIGRHKKKTKQHTERKRTRKSATKRRTPIRLRDMDQMEFVVMPQKRDTSSTRDSRPSYRHEQHTRRCRLRQHLGGDKAFSLCMLKSRTGGWSKNKSSNRTTVLSPRNEKQQNVVKDKDINVSNTYISETSLPKLKHTFDASLKRKLVTKKGQGRRNRKYTHNRKLYKIKKIKERVNLRRNERLRRRKLCINRNNSSTDNSSRRYRKRVTQNRKSKRKDSQGIIILKPKKGLNTFSKNDSSENKRVNTGRQPRKGSMIKPQRKKSKQAGCYPSRKGMMRKIKNKSSKISDRKGKRSLLTTSKRKKMTPRINAPNKRQNNRRFQFYDHSNSGKLAMTPDEYRRLCRRFINNNKILERHDAPMESALGCTECFTLKREVIDKFSKLVLNCPGKRVYNLHRILCPDKERSSHPQPRVQSDGISRSTQTYHNMDNNFEHNAYRHNDIIREAATQSEHESGNTDEERTACLRTNFLRHVDSLSLIRERLGKNAHNIHGSDCHKMESWCSVLMAQDGRDNSSQGSKDFQFPILNTDMFEQMNTFIELNHLPNQDGITLASLVSANERPALHISPFCNPDDEQRYNQRSVENVRFCKPKDVFQFPCSQNINRDGSFPWPSHQCAKCLSPNHNIAEGKKTLVNETGARLAFADKIQTAVTMEERSGIPCCSHSCDDKHADWIAFRNRQTNVGSGHDQCIHKRIDIPPLILRPTIINQNNVGEADIKEKSNIPFKSKLVLPKSDEDLGTTGKSNQNNVSFVREEKSEEKFEPNVNVNKLVPDYSQDITKTRLAPESKKAGKEVNAGSDRNDEKSLCKKTPHKESADNAFENINDAINSYNAAIQEFCTSTVNRNKFGENGNPNDHTSEIRRINKTHQETHSCLRDSATLSSNYERLKHAAFREPVVQQSDDSLNAARSKVVSWQINTALTPELKSKSEMVVDNKTINSGSQETLMQSDLRKVGEKSTSTREVLEDAASNGQGVYKKDISRDQENEIISARNNNVFFNTTTGENSDYHVSPTTQMAFTLSGHTQDILNSTLAKCNNSRNCEDLKEPNICCQVNNRISEHNQTTGNLGDVTDSQNESNISNNETTISMSKTNEYENAQDYTDNSVTTSAAAETVIRRDISPTLINRVTATTETDSTNESRFHQSERSQAIPQDSPSQTQPDEANNNNATEVFMKGMSLNCSQTLKTLVPANDSPGNSRKKRDSLRIVEVSDGQKESKTGKIPHGKCSCRSQTSILSDGILQPFANISNDHETGQLSRMARKRHIDSEDADELILARKYRRISKEHCSTSVYDQRHSGTFLRRARWQLLREIRMARQSRQQNHRNIALFKYQPQGQSPSSDADSESSQ